MRLGAGWFKDFADPQSMLEPTFKGSDDPPSSGNINLPSSTIPKIDEAMDKAALLEGEERLKAWADIDKMITAQARRHPVRLGQDDAHLVQERERGRQPRTTRSWDLTFTSLK